MRAILFIFGGGGGGWSASEVGRCALDASGGGWEWGWAPLGGQGLCWHVTRCSYGAVWGRSMNMCYVKCAAGCSWASLMVYNNRQYTETSRQWMLNKRSPTLVHPNPSRSAPEYITRQWSDVYILYIMHNNVSHTFYNSITRDITYYNVIYILSLVLASMISLCLSCIFFQTTLSILWQTNGHVLTPTDWSLPLAVQCYTAQMQGGCYGQLSLNNTKQFVFMASSVSAYSVHWGGDERWPLLLPLSKEPSVKE